MSCWNFLTQPPLLAGPAAADHVSPPPPPAEGQGSGHDRSSGLQVRKRRNNSGSGTVGGGGVQRHWSRVHVLLDCSLAPPGQLLTSCKCAVCSFFLMGSVCAML